MITSKEVHEQLEQNQKDIELAQCLKRLTINQDFVKLIMMYYSNEYVLSLVSNLAKYDKESLEYKETMNELHSISSFKMFLDIIKQNGAMAEHSLKELMTIPIGETDE